MKKTICIKSAVLTIVLISMLVASVSASTVEYSCVPPAPSVVVTQGGNTAIISGTGFKPSHAVNIFLDDAELPYVGDACTPQGTFTAIIVVPNDVPLGVHVVKVTDNFGHTAFGSLTVVSLRGADGRDGLDGVNGADGKDGIDGTNGADGTQGPAGIDGINGINGVNGTNGKDGTNGVNGTNGKDGLNGATGTRGYQGPIGETGSQGPQGNTGTQGIQGNIGTDGVDGQTTSGDYQGLVLAGLFGIIAAFTVLLAIVIAVLRKK